ncbi:CBU_0592 family membrane protein [Croceivirga sp. JEA036]|uniref:CBU_0592 family membrane protein n=1 Tax=Croceivirga sp. JEA036 TaxID=2721162 RepID=UPI00143BAA44|nr:hypothetical protein [Croceivirga sp. JEA036]NJB37965.1 hypothetical protein [Croceivirga sp. JEA036]
MKLLISILGWSGSGLVIIAYALTLMQGQKYLRYGKYLNLFGGLFIAINCYYHNAMPSFFTNIIWTMIATATIFQEKKRKRISTKHRKLT